LGIYHNNGTNWDIGDVDQSVKESSNDFGFYETIDANMELTVSGNYGVAVLAYPTVKLIKLYMRYI
jgi:hypothetical protein